MLTHLEFRSGSFSALPGEENLVNPSLWGKLLADFLRDGLRGEGFETGEPIAEDWGWVVPLKNREFRLWIGCGHYQEYADGFLCFIEPHNPFVRRFLRKIDTRERITRLQHALDRILSESAGVREKHWRTHEEFNRLALRR